MICYVFRVIPESFRWHLANDKVEQAEQTIKAIAKFNGLESVKIDSFMVKPEKVEMVAVKRYTVLDLLKTRKLLVVLLISSLNWYETFVVVF